MKLTPGTKLPHSKNYSKMVVSRRFYQSAYKGGQKFRDAHDEYGDPVLWRYNEENYADYERRRKRGRVHPHLSSIIDKYVSFALRNGPKRMATTEWYDKFIHDVNNNGTDINKYLEHALTQSMINLEHYAIVSTNSLENVVLGDTDVKPIIKSVYADDVPWTCISHDTVTKAIVLLQDDKYICKQNPEGKYAIYADTVQIIKMTISKSNSDWFVIKDIVDHYEHKLGRCPLIRISSETEMTPSVANAMLDLFNYDSLLKQNCFNTTFNQKVYTGIDERPDEINEGTDVAVGLPSGADVKFVAPPPSTITTIQNLISDNNKLINSYAGIGTAEPNQVESGLAKAFKFDELNVRIVNIIKSLEKFENNINKVAARAIGMPEVDHVAWPDDVSLPDRLSEFERTDKITSSNNIPNVLKRKEIESLAALYDLSEQQKRRLQIELEEKYPIIDEEIPTDEADNQDNQDNQDEQYRGEIILLAGEDDANHVHRANINESTVESTEAENHTHIISVVGESISVSRVNGHSHAVDEIE